MLAFCSDPKRLGWCAGAGWTLTAVLAVVFFAVPSPEPGAAPECPACPGTPTVSPDGTAETFTTTTTTWEYVPYHHGGEPDLYKKLTGLQGLNLPWHQGRQVERTIWLYWHTKNLPAYIKLCIESVQKHKGKFDVKVVYPDEVSAYVSRVELPFRWDVLPPTQQRDSLMNALLARYGGVALDARVILFDSLDEWWDNMLQKRQIFRGYWHPAEDPEVSVWFMMGRRERIFRSAVASQVIGMGDYTDTRAYSEHYKDQYNALGDLTVRPILSLYDHRFRRCVRPADGSSACYPPEYTNDVAPEQGPELLHLRVADDGPDVRDFCNRNPDCASLKVAESKDPWQEFLRRYRKKGLIKFVSLVGSDGGLSGKSRADLVGSKDSYFVHWLCLARVDNIDCSSVQSSEYQHDVDD